MMLFCAVVPCRAVFVSQLADDSQRAQEEEKAARKFDEFQELLRHCDLSARLDNLAIQLQAEPESKAFVIVYQGKYDLPARVSAYRARISDYLVNMRGTDPARLVVIDGGYRQIVTTELWIVGKGVTAPDPGDTINVKQELDKAFKFEEYPVYLADISRQFAEQSGEEAETIEEAGAGAEAVTEEAASEQPLEAREEIDAAQARSEESEEVSIEAEEVNTVDDNVGWASKDYARALEMEAKSGGHIIFYADRERADFSRVKEVVERGKTKLIEKYGVKAERLTMTFGGYRESSAIELWLVPASASLPLPTPDPEKQEETAGLAK
jgi:hypothetical protein